MSNLINNTPKRNLNELFEKWKNLSSENKSNYISLKEKNYKFREVIIKNINEILIYYENLDENKKSLLKKYKSIQYLFWESYKKNLISWKLFLKLNNEEYSGKDKSYLRRQYKILLNSVKDKKLLLKLKKEYSDIEKLDSGQINYYFDENIKFYSKLIEPNMKKILLLIEEIFKNTNSEFFGISKKIINKWNSIGDIIHFFNNVKSCNIKEIEKSIEKIKHLGDSIGFETFGLYNLEKEDYYIYNSRIVSTFFYLFEIKKKTQNWEEILPKYKVIRKEYNKYFNLNNNILKLNFEVDNFLYWISEEELVNLELLDLNEELNTIFKNPNYSNSKKNKYSKNLIRQNQPIFRGNLLKEFKKTCPITGIKQEELLFASHIRPFSKCDNEVEKAIKENGFLLSSNIDKLFDSGLITFTENSQMKISKKLLKSTIKLLNLNINEKYNLNLNEKRLEFLKYHNDHVFEKRKN